jgi:hypothetical protein
MKPPPRQPFGRLEEWRLFFGAPLGTLFSPLWTCPCQAGGVPIAFCLARAAYRRVQITLTLTNMAEPAQARAIVPSSSNFIGLISESHLMRPSRRALATACVRLTLSSFRAARLR